MIENDINKFLEAIKQFEEHIYEATQIFLGNPFDLIEIDMLEIPFNCYFISDNHMERGVMFKVEDSELKRSLYEFVAEFPNRVFRGKKTTF